MTLSQLLTSWILDSWVVGEFGWRRSEGFVHYNNRYSTIAVDGLRSMMSQRQRGLASEHRVYMYTTPA